MQPTKYATYHFLKSGKMLQNIEYNMRIQLISTQTHHMPKEEFRMLNTVINGTGFIGRFLIRSDNMLA